MKFSTLQKILRSKNFQNQSADFEIESLTKDSEAVSNNSVYFCLTSDSHKALKQTAEAISNGAQIVVSNFDLPFAQNIEVDDVREVFARACKMFYENASDRLKIIGVTGTNGKTSTTHIISEILKRNGRNCGVIGTSGVYFNGKVYESPLTTPDADFLHKTFKQMVDDGVEYAAMEVSAHAIDQKRIAGIQFEIGVLTNITQDHLDYFETMEKYEKTKLSFLTSEYVKRAIICIDNERARNLYQKCDVPIATYGIKNPADAFAIDVCCGIHNSHFIANIQDEVLKIQTNLIGQYNIYNSLASLLVCKQLGLTPKELEIGTNYINPVEGRFNVINIKGKHIVIDYAHSPDGIYNVLTAAKMLANQKVCIVFGCGGNRDKTKRAQMGKIAEELADYVCLTDDNPRWENSFDIIRDIESGMTKNHFVETDRKTAIFKMIDFASPGDILVIAGKGAEKYQEVAGEKRPYNDYDVISEYAQQTKSRGKYYVS